MKTIRSLLAAIALAVPLAWTIPIVVVIPSALVGCATLHGDPVVIHAEQAVKIGFDICNAFVVFEHQRNSQGELGPEVRAAAEEIRQHAPGWIESANLLIKVYKANKTPENKANLLTALAVLQAGVDEANRNLALGKVKP